MSDTGPDEGDAGRAVVDRVVEGLAVLLVGDAETEVEVPAAALPDGAGEGSVVTVRSVDGSVEVLAVDDAATAAARDRAAAQRDRLRGRSRRFGNRS